ncbi:MAG: hypothetical protein QM751_01430 [Paludibacteraceae bacterium]
MKFRLVITTVLVCSSAALLSAQKPDSVVNRSVTVEREFQPIIQDAGKIISTPKEIEPQVERTQPVYADFTTPLNTNYTLYPLDPELLVHKQNDTRKGLIRLGIGYPINTLGDFRYPLVKNENNRLDFSLRHLGAFGDKTYSKTIANLQYDHLFDNFNIFTGLSTSHDYFNYYGRFYGITSPFIMSDAASRYGDAIYTKKGETTPITLYELSAFPLNETHWRININVGIKSLPQSDDVKYLIDLQYNVFQSIQEQMNENHLTLKGMFEVPFNDDKLGMNIEINNLQYSVHNLTNFSFPKTYSVIKINPYYKIVGDFGFLRLSVKTGVSGQGQTFTPSPDVEVQWNAIPENVALYGGVTGDIRISTMSVMYNENRYLSSPLRLNDLYTPINAFAGVKFKPVYNFLLDVFGNYKIINKQYFFINRLYTSDNMSEQNLKTIYQNRFDIIYADAKQSTVGLRADYNYKSKINVDLKGAYHYWDVQGQQYAWQMPIWDIDFGANAQIMNDINIYTELFLQDGRYAKLDDRAVKMNPALDINLGASYLYNEQLSFFAKLNNLLNKHYDSYYGYQVQGINIMAGITFSF